MHLPRLKHRPQRCLATLRPTRRNNLAAQAMAVASQKVASQAVVNSMAANLAAKIQTPIPTARRAVHRRRVRYAIRPMPRSATATT
jgi:hypothetical protein